MKECGICRTLYPELEAETDEFCYECRYGAVTDELVV